MKPKPTCKFCGSKMILHRPDLALMEFACGTGIATEVCHGILWSENQSMECLKSERAHLAARVAEMEARCKRLEEAAREVYLDSIASDHPWTEPETRNMHALRRNMHALRDVLEAKP